MKQIVGQRPISQFFKKGNNSDVKEHMDKERRRRRRRRERRRRERGRGHNNTYETYIYSYYLKQEIGD